MASVFLLTRTRFQCPCCQQRIHRKYFADHLLQSHFHYNPYKCVQPNCGSQWPSEILFNSHCDFKHNGMKKCVVNNDSSMDAVAEKVRFLSQFPESEFAASKLKNALMKLAAGKQSAQSVPPSATATVKVEIVENDDIEGLQELWENANSSKSPGGGGGGGDMQQANFFDRWKKYQMGGAVHQQPNRKSSDNNYDISNQVPSTSSSSLPLGSRKRPSRLSSGIKPKRRKQSATTERKGLKECQLCHSEVTAVKNHMLFHLKKTLGVAWLFKCLLCETFETVYWCNFHVHVTSVHGLRVNALQAGVDYINRRADYKKELQDLQLIAFPQIESQYRGGVNQEDEEEEGGGGGGGGGEDASVSQISRQSGSASALKAIKREEIRQQPLQHQQHPRRKVVSTSTMPSRNRSKHCYLCNSDVNAMTIRDHSLSHLKEQTGIPGLYKCLLCNSLQTVYYRCLQKHMAVVHGEQIETMQNNVHYLDHKSKYEQQIQQVHQLAFPADGVSTIRSVNQNNNNNNNSFGNYRCKINRYKKVFNSHHRNALTRSKTVVGKQSLVARKTKNYRPQCQLCGVETNYTMTTGHVISHLKETGEIPWFYKCLLCDDLTTFYFRSLQIHMLYIHEKRRDALQENVDYANQKARFADDIKKIHALAFPPNKSTAAAAAAEFQENDDLVASGSNSNEQQQQQQNFSKFKQVGNMHSRGQQPMPVFVARGGRNAPSKNPQLSCQLCPAKLSTSTVYSHALVHLKEKTGIPWLYKCLLCKEFDSVYLSSLNSHMFTVHREQRSMLQEGVHFLDQKTKYEEEIRQVRLLAFPSTESSSTSAHHSFTQVKNPPGFLSVKEISSSQKLVNSGGRIPSSPPMVSMKPKQVKPISPPESSASGSAAAAAAAAAAGFNNNSRHFCQICGTEVHSTTMNSHSMSHLKEQTGIPWLYKCLLCDKVRTVHSRCLSVHMLKVHKKNRFTLQPGVHYIDQRFKYEQEIEHVRRLAFPGSIIEQQQQSSSSADSAFADTASNSSFVNDETSGSSTETEQQQTEEEPPSSTSVQYSCQTVSSKNRVQCQLCNSEVHPASTGGHSLSHFKEQTGIQWLYKCLLCTDFHTIYHRSVQAHLIKLHNKRRMTLQEGVHYMSQLSKYKKEVEQVRLLAFPTNQSAISSPESSLKLKIKVTKVKEEEPDFGEESTGGNIPVDHYISSTKPKRGANRFSLTQVLPQNSSSSSIGSGGGGGGGSCRLQCNLCTADVSSTSVESHVFSHLKEEASIPWLFKCLICQNFNSIYYRSLRKHMLEVHGLDYTKMKPGSNFVDQTSKYLDVIKQVQVSAFPMFAKNVVASSCNTSGDSCQQFEEMSEMME